MQFCRNTGTSDAHGSGGLGTSSRSVCRSLSDGPLGVWRFHLGCLLCFIFILIMILVEAADIILTHFHSLFI